MSNEAKVKAMIAEHLCVEPEKVTDEAHLIDDLDGDSLDILELTMNFEDHFNIEISESEVDAITSVADAVRVVDQKVAERLNP